MATDTIAPYAPKLVLRGTWLDTPEVTMLTSKGSVVFELAPEVAIPAGSVLLFTIEQQFADGTHNLGKFRLSLLQTPLPAP